MASMLSGSIWLLYKAQEETILVLAVCDARVAAAVIFANDVVFNNTVINDRDNNTAGDGGKQRQRGLG